MGKSLDESLVMTYQAQKGSDFSIGLKWGEFRNSFQILLAGPNALLGYMIGQIIDLIVEEFTFTQLEFQVKLLKVFKHNRQASQMLLLSFGKDNHIIQIDCLGNSALISGRLQGYCTTQRACIHTLKILGSPL